MVLAEAQIIEKEALVCLKPFEVSLGPVDLLALKQDVNMNRHISQLMKKTTIQILCCHSNWTFL
jgi:hypothetical protein